MQYKRAFALLLVFVSFKCFISLRKSYIQRTIHHYQLMDNVFLRLPTNNQTHKPLYLLPCF